MDENGTEVARGIVNYNSQESTRIMRKASSEIEKILGYVEESELIHRDNLILI
jgi:glutamate 5-kinase